MGYTVITNRLWEKMSDREAIALSRACVKNNQGMYAHYGVATTEKFLPHVLVYLGLFVSTSQVRKNRPDLWRDVRNNEVVEVGKIIMRLYTCDHIIEVDFSKVKPKIQRLIEAHERVCNAIAKLKLI